MEKRFGAVAEHVHEFRLVFNKVSGFRTRAENKGINIVRRL